MTIIDLADPEEMAKAVQYGYIWSAPYRAIEEACARIADGTIPMPRTVPDEWMALIYELTGGKVPEPAPEPDFGRLS